MTRVRARGEDVRRFIVENLEKHPGDIAKVAAEHFKSYPPSAQQAPTETGCRRLHFGRGQYPTEDLQTCNR